MNFRGLAANAFHTATGRSKLIRSLEASMFGDPAARRRVIERKLHGLMITAKSETSFWTNHPCPASASDCLSALGTWPILTRNDLRVSARNLRTGHPGRVNHSGGSTGEPVTFLQDRNYWRYNYADKVRTYRLCGFELGQPAVWVWSSSRDFRDRNHPARAAIDRFVLNITWYNTFILADSTCRRILDHLADHPPALIVGYASALEHLARFSVDNRYQTEPGSIQSSGETLTARARQAITKAFSAPLYDRYGSREFGVVAHECDAHDALHVLAENNWVELLNESGDPSSEGEIGRIVITNLNNTAQPFIRYDTGDLAVWNSKPCGCGRTLPKLRRIVGRRRDVIRVKDGPAIHGSAFNDFFFRREDVEGYQVVQRLDGSITIRLVTPNRNVELEQEIRNWLHSRTGRELELQFEYVQSIAATTSGKRLLVVREEEA